MNIRTGPKKSAARCSSDQLYKEWAKRNRGSSITRQPEPRNGGASA